MKVRLFSALAFALMLAATGVTQPAAAPATAAQAQPQPRSGGEQGFGMGMGAGMGEGRGLGGTVTEVAADHYTIKDGTGQSYTVHFSANTRIMRQTVHRHGQGEGEGREQAVMPETIKPADIHVGDTIGAMGEVDESAKSIGAVFIVVVDPERARMMREAQANYGKTWLMGKVTAIVGVKVSLLGAPDHAAHEFVADENTTFRKRREPITLADIAVGDVLRVDGAVKDGSFLATSVSVMVMSQGGTPTVPREGAPPAAPR